MAEPYKTFTIEGSERKKQRLMVKKLNVLNPELHDMLCVLAEDEINRDNNNPQCRVQDLGLYGMPHNTSETVRTAKQAYLKNLKKKDK